MRLVVLALWLGACGGHTIGQADNVIGSRCATDRDCDDRCYQGAQYPNGFCSVPCASDRDCPSDTYCVDMDGGVCLFQCPGFACGVLGTGWACHDRNDKSGAVVVVCTGG